MIALTAVVIAVVSQAASIDWSIAQNQWVLNNGTKPSEGYAVYLINGATALDTIASAIDSKTGAFSSDQTWVFGSSATSGSKGKVSKLTTESANLTSGTSYDFSVLMIDATNTSDIRYMVSDIYTMKAYDTTKGDEVAAIAFTSEFFSTGALTYDATNAANGWAAVPEPTSGLLILLGVAGLALRRRRV